MNASSRRARVEAMLAKDPQDQFLRYTLALDCAKEGEDDRCLELFQGLMADATPHVPSFLMAGQHLLKLDRVEDARSVLRAGIEAARQQGNGHAASEMSELLASLGNSK